MSKKKRTPTSTTYLIQLLEVFVNQINLLNIMLLEYLCKTLVQDLIHAPQHIVILTQMVPSPCKDKLEITLLFQLFLPCKFEKYLILFHTLFQYIQFINFNLLIYYCFNQLSNLSFIQAMTEADPQLLSLLQKVSNPITQVNLTLNIKGVFAPPQQWKTTDQANPNIFGYSLQLLNRKFSSGKIYPKTGVDANVNQADDKNKKGGKNPVKQQQKPVSIDPEVLKRQQQWQALPEQQKFYRTNEDPEKMYSLKFTESEINQLLQNEKLTDFEQLVSESQAQIILIRKPQISEDEIAKLKKSKPKTLNLGQLYEAKYKGIIDLSELQVPGCQNLLKRVKFQFCGDLPADGVKIETQNTYVLVQITLDKPLSPQVVEIKPQLQQVLPNIENLSKKSVSVIQKLKRQITRAIKAVNQQYITFFSKEKDFVDDKKNTGFNSISTLRLNQISKRKQLFLNQFSNSGKFSALRQRISQTLKAIIVDKFRKQKTAGPISKQKIHKTLSELNVFFQQFFKQTIDFVLTNQNATIHEDILLNHQSSKAQRKQSIAPVVNQTKEQKQVRIAQEYDAINNVKKTQQKYLNLVLMKNQNIDSLQKYGRFLIKNKKFDTAYEIYKKINKQSNDPTLKFVLCLFMVQRNRIKQVLQILTEMIENERSPVSMKYLYTNCLSFMYEQQGDYLKSQKYLALSQKYFQMNKNPQLKINPPINPYTQPKPLIPKPQRYTSQLTSSQTQQMWSSFIKFLQDNYFYDLLQKILPKMSETNKKKIIKIKVQLFKQRYENSLELLQQMLEKDPKNLDLLQMKAQICFKYEKIFECQQVFLLILKQKPSHHQSYKAYLRLGYTYLNRKSWQDAKGTFQKVCELKSNCSLGWLGLGISLLELGKLKQAQQAFSMNSIYNQLSQQADPYLQRINSIRNKQNLSNYKYLESSN